MLLAAVNESHTLVRLTLIYECSSHDHFQDVVPDSILFKHCKWMG